MVLLPSRLLVVVCSSLLVCSNCSNLWVRGWLLLAPVMFWWGFDYGVETGFIELLAPDELIYMIS